MIIRQIVIILTLVMLLNIPVLAQGPEASPRSKKLPLCYKPKRFPYSSLLPKGAFVVDYRKLKDGHVVVFYFTDYKTEPCNAWWHQKSSGELSEEAVCRDIVGTGYISLVRVGPVAELAFTLPVSKDLIDNLDNYFGLTVGDYTCDGIAEEVAIESNLSHSGTPPSTYSIYGHQDGVLKHYGDISGRGEFKCRHGTLWVPDYNNATGHSLTQYRFQGNRLKVLKEFSNHNATLFEGKPYDWPSRVFPKNFKGQFLASFAWKERAYESPPVGVWLLYSNRPNVRTGTETTAKLAFVSFSPKEHVQHQTSVNLPRMNWKECSWASDFSVKCQATGQCDGRFTCAWFEETIIKTGSLRVPQSKSYVVSIFFKYDPRTGFSLVGANPN